MSDYFKKLSRWRYDKKLYDKEVYNVFEVDESMPDEYEVNRDDLHKNLCEGNQTHALEACVKDVLNDSAKIVSVVMVIDEEDKYPLPRIRTGNKEVEPASLLAFYLSKLGTPEVDFEKARDFTEWIRKRIGMFDGHSNEEALRSWFIRSIKKHFYGEPKKMFYGSDKQHYYYDTEWFLAKGAPKNPIPEDYFKYACYIATVYLKYGGSLRAPDAEEIFHLLTMLGSDLPAKLKKYGSGEIPESILNYKDEVISCKANDALATIRITMKEEAEENYRKALDYLIKLLSANFPMSYSIDFRSPAKNYLPIKGLPKKGVHQLFTNAVQYPALHQSIQQYAKLAMNQYEWYPNVQSEDGAWLAMPGTFAVFALGLLGDGYRQLVIDYLKCCDDEHMSIQGKFIAAYIAKFGFTQETFEVFLAGVESMQEQEPQYNKIYARAIANESSLRYLLNMKGEHDAYSWGYILDTIWGEDAQDKGKQVIKKAGDDLRPLYESIFE